MTRQLLAVCSWIPWAFIGSWFARPINTRRTTDPIDRDHEIQRVVWDPALQSEYAKQGESVQLFPTGQRGQLSFDPDAGVTGPGDPINMPLLSPIIQPHDSLRTSFGTWDSMNPYSGIDWGDPTSWQLYKNIRAAAVGYLSLRNPR